jgi:hypothetical protein
MDDMKVGYVTSGRLDADKSNAVLLVPGTSSLRHWAGNYIGPGKSYDTDKYFIVSVDAIGGGTSSQAKDGLGADFPLCTIRDEVRAQHEMVTARGRCFVLWLTRVIARDAQRRPDGQGQQETTEQNNHNEADPQHVVTSPFCRSLVVRTFPPRITESTATVGKVIRT